MHILLYIGQFKSKFKLSDNCISDLPDGMASLKNLEILDVEHCGDNALHVSSVCISDVGDRSLSVHNISRKQTQFCSKYHFSQLMIVFVQIID